MNWFTKNTQQSRNHFWTSCKGSYWFIIGTAPPVRFFMCIYSLVYTCSACCHEFWTSFTQVVLGQNWYSFTGTCHHLKNSLFHGKHVSTHQICSQNPVNSCTETHELSQLNSWIHLQNLWNHGSLFAGNTYSLPCVWLTVLRDFTPCCQAWLPVFFVSGVQEQTTLTLTVH